MRILATSREWLGIAGEAVMPVPTLGLPDPDRSVEEQNLLQYGAVELFRDRAVAVQPGWTLDESNREDVAEICRRLDGLPLAIELAASRLRALSEHEMLSRLSDHFRLLAAPQRTHAPSRQRTLTSCIEWSHGLCSPQEQLLWARLSVFVGGFELDLAQEVCAGDGLTAAQVFESLTSLVDKSILIGERHDDAVRFRMLETIREYGRDQLGQAGELHRLRRSHRDAYLRVVERADADWVSPRQAEWFARLDREHANVQAAIDFSLTQDGDTEAAMRILVAVFHFYWWGRGWAREGRLWLSRALEQAAAPSPVHARAMLIDASLSLADGDFEVGLRLLDAARAMEQTAADPGTAAIACWIDGCVGLYTADLARATASFDQGLDLLDLLEPDRELPVRLDILVAYASAVALLGDAERATWCQQEFLRITEPAQECFHQSYALWTFGLFTFQQGDTAGGIELLQRSIALRRGIRDLTGLGWSEESLAWAEGAAGHHERAATLLGTADQLWEIMGRPLATYQHMYPLHEACEQQAREQLGDSKFTVCFERGRSLGVDGAIAYALGERPAVAQTPSQSATREEALLTRREREIAALIGEGLSNRDIADRLTISVRTAETHAQHILEKLGYRSRAQIAAWVAQQPRGWNR